MSDRDRLQKDIDVTTSLSQLVTTYEEIAVMRIQKIRKSVVATRIFREGLVKVFADVRESRHREVMEMLEHERKRRRKDKLLTKRKKEVAMLLSPQERLSGSLTSEIVEQFLKALDREPVDVMIVGEMGKSIMEKNRPDVKFEYFDMPNPKEPISKLKTIVKALLMYEGVTIYYGRFVNLVDQIPAMTQLYDDSAITEKPGQIMEKKQEQFFLFEPSLDEVVNFFDEQILAILFKQTVDESRLAQLGSRIQAMEEASQNIEKELGKLINAHRRAVKEAKNRKQRQMLAGMSLWT